MLSERIFVSFRFLLCSGCNAIIFETWHRFKIQLVINDQQLCNKITIFSSILRINVLAIKIISQSTIRNNWKRQTDNTNFIYVMHSIVNSNTNMLHTSHFCLFIKFYAQYFTIILVYHKLTIILTGSDWSNCFQKPLFHFFPTMSVISGTACN